MTIRKGRTPLKPMHFKPISLINSAVSTDCFLSFDLSVAILYNSVSDSGEFIVIVAAVCKSYQLSSLTNGVVLTDSVSHAGAPTFFAEASFLSFSYTDRTFDEAGSVLGLAYGALMSAFKDDDSFDMFVKL